jgi:hypothetical protein
VEIGVMVGMVLLKKPLSLVTIRLSSLTKEKLEDSLEHRGRQPRKKPYTTASPTRDMKDGAEV